LIAGVASYHFGLIAPGRYGFETKSETVVERYALREPLPPYPEKTRVTQSWTYFSKSGDSLIDSDSADLHMQYTEYMERGLGKRDGLYCIRVYDHCYRATGGRRQHTVYSNNTVAVMRKGGSFQFNMGGRYLTPLESQDLSMDFKENTGYGIEKLPPGPVAVGEEWPLGES
jgi:hypothetical protein